MSDALTDKQIDQVVERLKKDTVLADKFIERLFDRLKSDTKLQQELISLAMKGLSSSGLGGLFGGKKP